MKIRRARSGEEGGLPLSPQPPRVFARVFEQHDCTALLSWSLEKATSTARFKLEEIFPDPEQFGTIFVLLFARTWVNPNEKKKKCTIHGNSF